jgi:Domain of unknown function (DUF4333)
MTLTIRRSIGALALVPACAVALAACGTETVDPKSAENVIKSQIVKFGSIQATSVSCPGGVEKKDGKTIKCKVTLKNTSTGKTASGTITLHITNGGKEAVFSGSDVKVQ